MLSSLARAALARRTPNLSVGAVRYLNLHEYQSAQIMKDAGVNVPFGIAAHSVEDAVKAAQEIKTLLSPEMIDQIVDLVPDDFLMEEGNDISPFEKRKVYSTFIKTKITNLDLLTKEANDARERSL